MVNAAGRSPGENLREQFITLQALAETIRSQEVFLQMVERETIIPDMARRLSKEAISGDLLSNKRVLLDFLYNLISRSGEKDELLDIEFHYILIGKEFFEVDNCNLWFGEMDLKLPYEIGEKFGKTIVGNEMVDLEKKILSFYKSAEMKFDREQFGNLDRCSLVILEEHYPQSSWHIRMRLPARILNDYPITI